MEIDTNLANRLKKAGLGDKEALIYSTLITLGGAYPTRIAEVTGLNRSTTYKILTDLSIKGLVTELEKGKKLFYQAENPKKIQKYTNYQITLAKQNLEELEKVMPTLEGLFSNSENKPVVRFFEGREGVLKVYEDHVDVKKPYEMIAFSNTSDLMQFITEKFREDYIKKKVKLGITTRAILPDQEIDINYNETIYKKFPKKIWPKLKHVPRNKFPYKSDITIYGENKVSIINFNEPQPVGTIIEDKIIHDMMKMIFELSWAGVDQT